MKTIFDKEQMEQIIQRVLENSKEKVSTFTKNDKDKKIDKNQKQQKNEDESLF